MSILDRFKSKKEQELKGETVSEPVAVKKPQASVPTKAKKSEKAIAPEFLDIIKKPLVTEKAAHLASFGQYTFEVAIDANRVSVSKAVKAMYGITPVSVNIQRVRGKVVRFGRSSGRRKAWKKAIVTLPTGKSIDVYEGV